MPKKKDQRVRLNLGSGAMPFKGWVNVDNMQGCPPKSLVDIKADIRELKWEKYTVDEILLNHVVMYLDPDELGELLRRWFDWLKPGGKICIETANLLAVCQHIIDAEDVIEQNDNEGTRQLFDWGNKIGSGIKFCYSPQMLAKLLENANYVNLKVGPGVFHKNEKRDLVMIAEKSITMTEPVITKLNLGSNTERFPGFTNVDIRQVDGVDLVDDVTKLETIKDESVEEIIAHNILEHFNPDRVFSILQLWVKKLKKGGTIQIGVPDLLKIMKDYETHQNWDRVIHDVFGNISLLRQWHGEDAERFGHHMVFSKDFLTKLMESAGLGDIKDIVPANHYAGMTLKGTKQ